MYDLGWENVSQDMHVEDKEQLYAVCSPCELRTELRSSD